MPRSAHGSLHRSPNPPIDVHLFHRYAIAALRSGVDPYAITFPDIYQGRVYYGSGLSVDGRLQFGYPYFPFSLLLSMPGQILFKDVRFAQLIAIELSALLMTFARPQGLGLMAAALYLTTPRMFFVLEQSWTEPFLVLGVSALVFAGCRHSRLTPWLFGAFVAMKQYLVFALPAAWLLVEAPRDRPQAADVPDQGRDRRSGADAPVRPVESRRLLEECRHAAVPSAVPAGRAQRVVVVGIPRA